MCIRFLPDGFVDTIGAGYCGEKYLSKDIFIYIARYDDNLYRNESMRTTIRSDDGYNNIIIIILAHCRTG